MNIWKELFDLCEVIRENGDIADSLAVNQLQINELERLLKLLPADDESLVGAEGSALYYEFIGNIPAAICSWQSALEKLTFLRKDLGENDYSEDVRRAVLGRCDDGTINRCILAIQRLESLSANGPMDHD